MHTVEILPNFELSNSRNMERKQNLYGLLFCVVALTSCHSPANKGNGQGGAKKDTVKTIAQAPPPNKATSTFVILDTVAGRDTIKVVLYRDSMIRCSINNLSDTFNAARDYMHWDTSYSNLINEEVAPILIPRKKKPAKFILNDSLFIFPLFNENFRTKLYLVNRTKTSLKFAENGLAGSYSSSYYIYVDLKKNIIYTLSAIDYSDSSGTNPKKPHFPYEFDRYKIFGKHLVNTETGLFGLNGERDELPSSFEEFQGICVDIADYENKKDSVLRKTVIDFIKKYFSNWYLYCELYLIRNQNG